MAGGVAGDEGRAAPAGAADSWMKPFEPPSEFTIARGTYMGPRVVEEDDDTT